MCPAAVSCATSPAPLVYATPAAPPPKHYPLVAALFMLPAATTFGVIASLRMVTFQLPPLAVLAV
jgi:hypothetical protein